MSKLAKFLIEDLQGDWSKPSIKFFRSNDAYGYVIWLTLMNSHSEKEKLSIETIIKKDIGKRGGHNNLNTKIR